MFHIEDILVSLNLTMHVTICLYFPFLNNQIAVYLFLNLKQKIHVNIDKTSDKGTFFEIEIYT